MPSELDLLTEIRDLLQLIAEPQLAQRDQKYRAALREVVGTGKLKQAATLLMDGTRSQTAIAKESGIDQGQLSRLVKALVEKSLLTRNDGNPRLHIAVPPNFFEGNGNHD